MGLWLLLYRMQITPFLWDPINKTLETLFNRKIRKGMLAGLWANHVRLYTMPQLRDPVRKAGFEIEAERAFYPL